MKLKYYVIAVAAAGMIGSGCGKSDLQSKLEQAADSLKKAGEQMSKNVPGGGTSGGGEAQSGEQHKPVPAIDYHKLQGFLPTSISGFTMGKPEGQSMNMDQWNYSSANVEFTNDDQRIAVQIFDYAYIESLMQVYKMKFSFENEDGYTKTLDMGGYPGWETWQKKDKSASCVALIGDRYVVSLEGHNVNDPSVIRNVLTSMDLKGIAGLK